MYLDENGVLIGNWKKEEWRKLKEDIYELEVNGKNLTLAFVKIGPKAAGNYAPLPSVHRHYDMEQLTCMLEGHATVIMDGKRYPVKAGSHWLAPIGVDHGLDLRESPEGVTILQIFPAGHRAATRPGSDKK